MVIGYQVDEFIHMWSVEQFVAHSHIYPGFMGMVSSLTHFPLESGCEDYSFLNQAVADFAQGLDSILTDSIETPKLDTSLDEPDAITSSVSSGFLCLVSARLGSFFHLCLWLPRYQHLNLICYFSSHPAAFGFWSSTPPDNITLTPANRKLIRVCQNFRLTLVLLPMPLLTQSSSFLTSELPLLILFSHYQILWEELFLFWKCMNYFSRLMTFWTMLCPNELVTWLML